ncbi:hypothetical protein K435DRAFT_50180 [Dendrothele bispora CBS 962.96]|uniref:Fungal-type protein kinase domain-containing protein n=1 Tax=Dendrothele bispora (strain CBS 962.96) TaxID=1314807 RepID=A0A4S8M6F0_DENBC|nr:hypothetical protein K435DRAFT_50180 [Dendrothele bispora CBS 962.96]
MTIDNLSKIDTLQITAAVQHDLQNDTRLATHESFLHNFFPVTDENVGKVFVKLKETGLYSERAQRWTGFPEESDRPEVNYYGIIQDTQQQIQDTYCAEAQMEVQRVWKDTHSTAPESFTGTAANRPDVVQGIGGEAEWNDRMAKLVQLPEEFRKNLRAYWFRTATVVGVKPKSSPLNSEETYHTVQRLAGYMHQVLREQLDRRFVFGLIFLHDCMSVWYCDRSGLLGMDKVLNIHEEPEVFIRVIASLSTKSFEDLGWDPTMRFFQVGKLPQYSYELDFSKNEVVEYFQNSDRQYSKWVITIDGREYVTIRALSLSRAEIMCGRGQLVWSAVDVQNRKIVVIKQSWSPFTLEVKASNLEDGARQTRSNIADLQTCQIRSEAKVYLHAVPGMPHEHDHYIARLEAQEIVPGTRTEENFRCDIEDSRPSSSIRSSTTLGKRREPGDEHTKTMPREEQLHEQLTNALSLKFGDPLRRFTERQLCRMVFKDFGWPIKCFRSLEELLDILGHCLEGYEFLLTKGIVHRDISPSNMLICPVLPFDPTQPAKVVGRLNDLDHSKVDVDYTSDDLLQDNVNQPTLDEIMKILPLVLPVVLKSSKTPDCSVDLYKILVGLKLDISEILMYLCAVLKTLPKLDMLPDQVIEPETLRLGVKLTDCMPPKFTSRLQGNNELSGTMPFISHRLLRRIYPPVHTAVHDMESVFWVLLYLCLTREGPGDKLRDALCKDPSEIEEDSAEAKIGHLVYCFFDAEEYVLEVNKRGLFEMPNAFQEHVVPSIHPYFDPLKPLLEEWFRILCVAYTPRLDAMTFPEYVWPHLSFQRALTCFRQESERKLDTDSRYAEMTRSEDQRRTKYIDEILKALDDLPRDGSQFADAPIQELDPSLRARQDGSRKSNLFN